jgi:integrase
MSTPTSTMTAATGPIDPISTDLAQVLRALKLSGLKDTLPERLALARTRTRKMGHAAFLELLLSDEVSRRDSRSAMLRARTAGLDPTMVLDTWILAASRATGSGCLATTGRRSSPRPSSRSRPWPLPSHPGTGRLSSRSPALRIGEALGLNVSDVDFLRRTVKVER